MSNKQRQTYRAAQIGCGNVGSTIEDRLGPGRIPLPYSHARSLKSIPEIDFVAAADIDTERLQAFAARWEVPALYQNYREMLERERPELLVVAGPSPLHAEMVIAAAEAGVSGVFCEKPLATNLRDANRMIEACDQSGTKLSVNHLRRFEPFYRQARQLVADGVIGETVSAEATWRGAMLFAGTHLFDAVHYLLGDPQVEWLVGDLDQGADDKVDPGGSAYVRYSNGIHAFMNADARNAVPIQVDIIGTDGKIVIGNYNLELWKRNRESRYGELIRHPFPASIVMSGVGVTALKELIGSVESGGEGISSGRVAKVALTCCLAVHDSARQANRLIKFPFSNLDLDVSCR